MKKLITFLSCSLLLLTACTSIENKNDVKKDNEETAQKVPSTKKEFLKVLNDVVDKEIIKSDLGVTLDGSLAFKYQRNENEYFSLNAKDFNGIINASNLPFDTEEDFTAAQLLNNIKVQSIFNFAELDFIYTQKGEKRTSSFPNSTMNIYFANSNIYLNLPNEISTLFLDAATEGIKLPSYIDIEEIKERLELGNKYFLPIDATSTFGEKAISNVFAKTIFSMYFKMYNEIYSEIFEFTANNDKFAAKIPLNYQNLKFIYDLHKPENVKPIEISDLENSIEITNDSFIQVNFTYSTLENVDIVAKGKYVYTPENANSDDASSENNEIPIDFNVNFKVGLSENNGVVLPTDLDTYQNAEYLIDAYKKIKEFIDKINK